MTLSWNMHKAKIIHHLIGFSTYRPFSFVIGYMPIINVKKYLYLWYKYENVQSSSIEKVWHYADSRQTTSTRLMTFFRNNYLRMKTHFKFLFTFLLLFSSVIFQNSVSAQRKMEKLDRGVVAVKNNSGGSAPYCRFHHPQATR